MEKLIDLASFRSRNGLSQVELGQYIGTSGAFISLVERQSAKMPADKMKKIWNLAEKNAWFTEDLVPAFYRLSIIDGYIETSQELTTEEIQTYHNKFDKAVPKTLFESIKLGQTPIHPALADRIISICPGKYAPNKEWLVNGDGPIFPWSSIHNSGTADGFVNEEKNLESLIRQILKKQDKLEILLNDVLKKIS